MKSLRNLGLLLCISSLLFACSSNQKGNANSTRAVPVTVDSVIQKNVPVELRAFGTVEPYSIVSIKALVGGEVTRVHFTEGQDVKKGDLLFTVDPRPYEASLKQAQANLAKSMAQVNQAEANLTKTMAQVREAEANLERDTAQMKNAEEQAHRYEILIEKGVVSKEQYDRFRTNADALEATVRADRAALENAQAAVRASRAGLENAQAAVQADRAAVDHAKLQVEYCYIRSPMDGRTGGLIVHQGNIVKANETPYLVIINQMMPIYATFSVPEQNLSTIKKYMALGKLEVRALLPNDENRPEKGILTFVNNTVDYTTGTIRLKGTFPNKEKRLWPGQFVNVALTLTSQPDAIVIPSQAIQTGQGGQYVFVVKPDLTVEVRPIAVNRILNNESIIEKGLQPGEKVVTDGQLQLIPGAKVELKGEQAPPEKRP